MATPKSQRIGIWIITIVMLLGVIGSFAVMILSQQDSQRTAAEQQKMLAKIQKQQAEADKEAKVLSDKYYPTFSNYKNSPSSFDPTTVGDKVTTNDLVVGDGADITDKSSYQAYYIGWDPDGKVFDSSFDDSAERLKTPLQAMPGGLIKGWSEGAVGMKVGGIRELTIPAELAYGKDGIPDQQNPGKYSIEPNTPLKFIMYVIKAD